MFTCSSRQLTLKSVKSESQHRNTGNRSQIFFKRENSCGFSHGSLISNYFLRIKIKLNIWDSVMRERERERFRNSFYYNLIFFYLFKILYHCCFVIWNLMRRSTLNCVFQSQKLSNITTSTYMYMQTITAKDVCITQLHDGTI